MRSRSGPSQREAGARMTALRADAALRARQPAGAPDHRAQPARLPARLARAPLGLLRAAVLPARRSASGSARSSATCPGPGGEPIPYALFVAPALLASVGDERRDHREHVQLLLQAELRQDVRVDPATPLSPGDIALGELAWALIRGGAVRDRLPGRDGRPRARRARRWASCAVPAALLIGFAFAAVGMAATSFMRTWQDFDLIQLVILPLFLFSARSSRSTTYPEPLRIIVQLTPLYHGVDLLRCADGRGDRARTCSSTSPT